MYANPGPHSYVLVQTHPHWHTQYMSQEIKDKFDAQAHNKSSKDMKRQYLH